MTHFLSGCGGSVQPTRGWSGNGGVFCSYGLPPSQVRRQRGKTEVLTQL
jgi:hypothetical protein